MRHPYSKIHYVTPYEAVYISVFAPSEAVIVVKGSLSEQARGGVSFESLVCHRVKMSLICLLCGCRVFIHDVIQ